MAQKPENISYEEFARNLYDSCIALEQSIFALIPYHRAGTKEDREAIVETIKSREMVIQYLSDTIKTITEGKMEYKINGSILRKM